MMNLKIQLSSLYRSNIDNLLYLIASDQICIIVWEFVQYIKHVRKGHLITTKKIFKFVIGTTNFGFL